MNKGNLMTGIIDGVANVTAIYMGVSKKAKEDGLLNLKEREYIANAFGQMIKDGNQAIENIRQMLSLKTSIQEEEKVQLLKELFDKVKANEKSATLFVKGFEKLTDSRKKKQTDINEVAILFAGKTGKKSSK